MLSSLKRAGALVVAMRTEQGKGESFTSNMKLFLFAGLCFALSYVGAFLSKWLLASIATGENEFILAASSAGVRFGAEDSAGIATLLIIGAAVFSDTHFCRIIHISTNFSHIVLLQQRYFLFFLRLCFPRAEPIRS